MPEKEKIQLFDKQSIDKYEWPLTRKGEQAKKYFLPLIQNGVSAYINNIDVDYRLLIYEDLILPLTIIENNNRNSYVCSFYTFYISYASNSLQILKNPLLTKGVKSLLNGLGKILRYYRLDQTVIINNGFFSTNFHPAIKPDQLSTLVSFLKEKFPAYTLAFRSIDSIISADYYHLLKKEAFNYIAYRQIYFINHEKQTKLLSSRLFKSDVKLLEASGYQILDNKDLTDADIPRLLELYQYIYLDKYSAFNPQFNEKYLKLVIKENIFHFKVLKKNGRIDGAVGYIEVDGKMYCPYFGHDCTLPKEASLYRLLSTVLMLEAHHKELFFHLSSGSSAFKKMRKADDQLEYLAVYYQHLSYFRRIPWWLLKLIYNRLGSYFMKRY